MGWSMGVLSSCHMMAGWIELGGQLLVVQTHGVERLLQQVALLVESQKILVSNPGCPIDLAIPLMLDEGTEVERNPCYPSVFSAELQ